MTSISIFLLVSLLESSNHQDEEHSLIARYAARLAADAAVRYCVYVIFIAHNAICVPCQKPVIDEKKVPVGFQAFLLLTRRKDLQVVITSNLARVPVCALIRARWMAGDLTVLLPPSL